VTAAVNPPGGRDELNAVLCGLYAERFGPSRWWRRPPQEEPQWLQQMRLRELTAEVQDMDWGGRRSD